MRFSVLVVFLSLPFGLLAQTLETDRPSQTQGSSVVPPGSFQWECGFSSIWTPGFGGNIRTFEMPNSLFRLGVSKRVELRIEHQVSRIDQRAWGDIDVLAQGVRDVELGAKLTLFQREGKKMQLAYLGQVVAPSGDEGLRGDWGVTNSLCVSHDVGAEWSLSYNLGVDFLRGSSIGTYAMAVGRRIDDRLGLYVEPYGEYDLVRENHWASLDGGLTFQTSEAWQWDLSFGTGLNHIMNYTAVGFSWRVLPKR
ncbi:MAG: transporter [Flavobacteriales bacterium]|nr:transporter [Flavobacteriales bacterium]